MFSHSLVIKTRYHTAASYTAALIIAVFFVAIAALAIFTIITFFPFSSSTTTITTVFNGDGAPCQAPCVMGRVTIGPLCPVEQMTTITSTNTTITTATCPNPISFSYSNHSLVFSPGSVLLHTVYVLPLNSDGTFRAEIPSGSWIVKMTNCNYVGCSSTFPETIFVSQTNATILNISIDTGIR